MKKRILLIAISLVFLSCNESSTSNDVEEKEHSKHHNVIEIKEENNTPTVDISGYKLIEDPTKDRRKDASEILKIKRQWPLAMQSLNPLEFEAILAKNFTFKGGDNFFNREDYIKNRTTPDDWVITFVKYDNLTLQFFGDIAVLSYKNRVENRNKKTGVVEYERITWVDMYVKEDGKWKIEASHSIDYQLEDPEKNKPHKKSLPILYRETFLDM